MSHKPFVAFIVAAAGSSQRMGMDKLFAPLGSGCAAQFTLCAAEKCAAVSQIIVACRPGDTDKYTLLAQRLGLTKFTTAVCGGATRQQSVAAALAAADARTEYIAVHDCARPFVTPELTERLCGDAIKYGAAIPALPITDTVKIRKGDFAGGSADRGELVTVQTPQVFRLAAYRAALQSAVENGLDFTDDSQLFEAAGLPVYLSEGDPDNIKLTRPHDLVLAQLILKEKQL